MAISELNFYSYPGAGAAPLAAHERFERDAGQRGALAPRQHVRVSLRFAAKSDKGLERYENQDTFRIDRGLGLAVLCDGMGGHAGGARASALGAHTFEKAIIAGKPLLQSYLDHRRPERVHKREIRALLQEAAAAASRAVYEEARESARCAGMGTTLVAVLVLANHAFIVNIGDSRAYLLRDTTLEQITRDHTVYAELMQSGCMPQGVYPRSGFRNVLTRTVGTKECCEADTAVIDVVPGDRILLCSDGVYQYLDWPDGAPEDLRDELLQKDGQRAADALIALAKTRGGSDDMTAVVLTLGALGEYEAGEIAALTGRHDALARSPLFAALGDDERASLLALAEVRAFEPGEAILGPDAMGGDLCVLLRGSVQVEQHAANAIELSPGQLVVAESWMNAGQSSTRAVARTASEVLVLQRQELLRLFRTDPDLAETLLRAAGTADGLPAGGQAARGQAAAGHDRVGTLPASE